MTIGAGRAQGRGPPAPRVRIDSEDHRFGGTGKLGAAHTLLLWHLLYTSRPSLAPHWTKVPWPPLEHRPSISLPERGVEKRRLR